MTARKALGDVAILVPAAGMGLRLGPGAPKALRELAGEPLLVHAVRNLSAAPSTGLIVVAAPPGAVSAVETLLTAFSLVRVVAGGDTRQASVANALLAVPSAFDLVLVHDAARCLAPPTLTEAVADAIRSGADAVVPVLPVVDTVKTVDDQGVILGTVDRSTLRAVQTPQGFRRAVLQAAHARALDQHTDDAGMVEATGGKVHTVSGDERAMKITRPFDLVIAEALLRVSGDTIES